VIRTLFLFLFFLPSLVICQQSTRERLLAENYDKADSIAIHFSDEKYDDPIELAKSLCLNLDSEQEKFRVIFRWIAENIEYKYGRFGTEPEEILKKKRAVCEGYASLLDAMCDAVNIQTRTVVGFAKSYPESHIPMNMKKSNHAWNAVMLAGEWHLVDVTWAAGTFNPKRRKFKQNFNEDFFLPDPDFFLLSHYPENLRWTLTNKIMKPKTFSKGPIYFPRYKEIGFQSPKKIKGKVKGTFKLTFSTDVPANSAAISFDKPLSEVIGVSIYQKGANAEVKVKLPKDEHGVFYLFIDGEVVMAFIHP